MTMLDWVRLPSAWIKDKRLRELTWKGDAGSNNTAALIVLAVIAHHTNPETGTAFLTYDQLTKHTGLSRTKVARGLSVLTEMELIDRSEGGRSACLLRDYTKDFGWSKLPARRLYNANNEIQFFHDLHLRSRTELDALKLYFLFAERRSNASNLALISYDKIVDYTGLDRTAVRRGISLLAANGMVHVEHVSSQQSEHGIANGYRLAHLDGRVNMATRNRGMDTTAHKFASLAESEPF